MSPVLSLYKGVIGPRCVGRRLSVATFERVLNEVAESTEILACAIVSDSRARHIAQPRQELMWRLHRLGYSTPEIGRLLKRDHSTVVHGIHAHKARMIAAEPENTELAA